MRPVADFAAGHRPGAVNVPVSGTSFSTKSGFVLDVEQPLVVLSGSQDEAAQAIRGLRSVAFLDIAGFVLGGGDERMDTVSADELEELVRQDAVAVIDVREADEVERGTIPGSLNVPYRLAWTSEALPRDRALVTVCETGPRAAVAASVLLARGYDVRPVIDGGVTDRLSRTGTTSIPG